MPPAEESTPLLRGSAGAAEPRTAERPSLRDVFATTLPLMVPEGRRQRAVAVAAAALQVVMSGLGVVPGLIMKEVVDGVAATASAGPADARVPYGLVAAYFALRLVMRVLSSGASTLKSLVMSQLGRDVYTNVYAHLQRLGMQYHLEKKPGQVSQIMSRGAGAVVSLTEMVLFKVAPTVIDAVAVCAVFWHLGSLPIAVVTVVSVAVYATFSVWESALEWGYSRRENELWDELFDVQWNCLGNYETTAAFGRTEIEVENSERLRDEEQALNAEVTNVMSALSFVQSTLREIGTTCGLLLAAYYTVYAARRLTPGDFFLIESYIDQLFGPLQEVVEMYGQVGHNLVDVEKVVVILTREPAIKDAPDAVDLVAVRDSNHELPGRIVFDDVSFTYKPPQVEEPNFRKESWDTSSSDSDSSSDGEQDSESDASTRRKKRKKEEGHVSNLSFQVEPGKSVALVGATGAGKSTIMRLLLRFYDVDYGSISLDGYDIRDVTQASLRTVIGYVSQEIMLFNETLRYNLGYGTEENDATDAHLMRAADIASLGDFIRKQELGLEYRPGARSSRMSGGERQRAGSARVIAKEPSMLLLDEATSALDSITERELQRAVRAWCRGRTTLIIAHRLSTVAHAHEILVLEKGAIIERGSHDQLLAAKGTYAEMWTLQTSNASDTED